MASARRRAQYSAYDDCASQFTLTTRGLWLEQLRSRTHHNTIGTGAQRRRHYPGCLSLVPAGVTSRLCCIATAYCSMHREFDTVLSLLHRRLPPRSPTVSVHVGRNARVQRRRPSNSAGTFSPMAGIPRPQSRLPSSSFGRRYRRLTVPVCNAIQRYLILNPIGSQPAGIVQPL